MKVINIVVKPNSPRTQVIAESGTEIRLAVAAPPEGGKANLDVVKFLTKKFGANVEITRGKTSRRKIVRVLV